MAWELNRLTATEVKATKKPGLYPDGGGLWLQVRESKGGGVNRSWIFRFTMNGKAKHMGLGSLSVVTLAEARTAAQDARKLIQAGIDPIKHRDEQRAAVRGEEEAPKTFKWCAGEYIKAHGGSWRNPKHRQQWENTLAAYVFPVIGDALVDQIDRAAVLKVLDPIWRTKTTTASRLRGRIAKILGWAKHRGYREGDNPADWKDCLEHDLPPKARVHKVQNFTALPFHEVGAFLVDLRAVDAVSARALEFLILTAARTGEALGATWDEIDTKRRLWTIPADRMKMRVEHNVPLSDDAFAIIEAMPRIKGNPHIFPGHVEGKSLSNMALLQLLRRMERDDLTAHGFRSSFRDWSAERTAFPRMVPELCLAHGPKDKTEAAYLRASLMDHRRQLLEAWAAYCGTVSGEQGNVTPLQRATANMQK